MRDKNWFKNSVTKIQELWKIIETEKVTGYQHRAPKRRINKKNDTNDESEKQKKLELNDDSSLSVVLNENTKDKKVCHSGLFF